MNCLNYYTYTVLHCTALFCLCRTDLRLTMIGLIISVVVWGIRALLLLCYAVCVCCSEQEEARAKAEAEKKAETATTEAEATVVEIEVRKV